MKPLSKKELLDAATRFLEESPQNYLSEDAALRPDLVGLRFFDAPILGVAAAGDPIFTQLQSDEAVGPMFKRPEDWLASAKSVLSFFLPFDQRIITANLGNSAEIPPEWLHGRIEGQNALDAMIKAILQNLADAGYAALAPSMDPRFSSGRKPDFLSREGEELLGFTSAWSERHVAFACGLGTFGLSRCLITSRGAAGRFGSIVTDLPLDADTRPYSRYDEYCNLCGECVPRCPAGALDVQKGKNMAACSDFQQACRTNYAPRYGCGKCSVGVLCSTAIPSP